MKKIDLSIIILNYNTRDFLHDCLVSLEQAIRKSPAYQVEVIVVDNGSSDRSLVMVKEKFPWVKRIENKTNFGFAKGNNIGIRASKGDYLLLLNSDTKIFANTLNKMLGYLGNHPEVGVTSCRVELPDGYLDPACHRGFPTPWNALTYFSGLEQVFPTSKLFSGYHLGWKNLNYSHEIDTPTGAFYLVRRQVLDQVGLLDESYFMYGEDIDLSYRIKKAGWKIMYVPTSRVVHYKKKSGREKKEKGKVTKEAKIIRAKTIYYFFQTMKIFYEKHYRKKYPLLVRFMVIRGIWLLAQIKLLFNRLK